MLQHSKRWRARNKKHIRQYKREYKARNIEACRGYGRTHYEKHKNRIRSRQRQYYLRNREHIMQCVKKYTAQHRDKVLARKRDWYQRNRIRLYKIAKLWRSHNADKIRAYVRNRKSRIRGASGFFTYTDILNIRTQQNNHCYYCGTLLLNNNDSIDHKIPIIRGGSNWPNNLCLTCLSCNKRKGVLTDKEFIIRLKTFVMAARTRGYVDQSTHI